MLFFFKYKKPLLLFIILLLVFHEFSNANNFDCICALFNWFINCVILIYKF